MFIINDLTESRFTLNGIQYFKNYISKVIGDRIVIFNCYDNKDVLVELSHFSDFTLNGSVYESATELQADLIGVIYVRTTLGEGSVFYQNNTGRSIYIGEVTGENLLIEIPEAINAIPITIHATEAIILFWAFQQTEEGLIRLQYLFRGGKGAWGSIGTPVTFTQLIQLASVTATVPDIENDPASVIIPLGELEDGDYLTTANAEEHNFSDSGEETADGVKSYYFSYTVPGENGDPDVLYLVLFIGAPGIYGGGLTNNDFTANDFAVTTNSDITPTPTPSWGEVMNVNNVSYAPAIILDSETGAKTEYLYNGTRHSADGLTITEFKEEPVANITITDPAKPADDVRAYLSDIQAVMNAIDIQAVTDNGNATTNSINIGSPDIPTLIIKGTSITAGTSIADVSNETEAYLYKTARALGLKYVNLGINARYVSPPTNASISFVNTRTDIPAAADFAVGSCIGFECLVNDSKADPALYNTATFESDLTLVVQAAIDKGWNPVNIILLNTAYYNPSSSWDVEAGHDAFTLVMQNVANTSGTRYYDGYYDFKTAYILDSSLLHTDIIHPTVAGHDYITEKFVEYLTTNNIFIPVNGQNLIVRGTINGSHTVDWDTAFNRGDFRDFGVGNIIRISDFNSPIFNSLQRNGSFNTPNAPTTTLQSVWTHGSASNYGSQFAISYGNFPNGYGNPEAWIRVKSGASTWTDWEKLSISGSENLNSVINNASPSAQTDEPIYIGSEGDIYLAKTVSGGHVSWIQIDSNIVLDSTNSIFLDADGLINLSAGLSSIILGTNVTDAIEITSGASGITINSNNGLLNILSGTGNIDISAEAGGYIGFSQSTGITVSGNAGGVIINGSTTGVVINGGSGNIALNGNSGGIAVDPQGGVFAYVSDVSSNYTDRSVVDKAFVDKLSKTTADTGTEVDFVSKKVFNSPSSPATSNITGNLLNATIGIVQKIYHNDSVEPTFAAGWVRMGVGEYLTDQLNIIYAEWVSGNRVEYWITQEA